MGGLLSNLRNYKFLGPSQLMTALDRCINLLLGKGVKQTCPVWAEQFLAKGPCWYSYLIKVELVGGNFKSFAEVNRQQVLTTSTTSLSSHRKSSLGVNPLQSKAKMRKGEKQRAGGDWDWFELKLRSISYSSVSWGFGYCPAFSVTCLHKPLY